MQLLRASLLALTIISVGCAATRSGGTLSTGITAGDRVLSAFLAWDAGHQVQRLSTFRSRAAYSPVFGSA
jgi:hypothetical protein